jgi:hypothetical protein
VSARSDVWSRGRVGAALAILACAGLLGGCATYAGGDVATGAPTPQSTRTAAISASVPAQAADEDMPADLGMPLPETAQVAELRGLSIDMPISSIAAKPAGRAVLDKDLPGLCERPEFGMFKGMSLKALAGMSNGKINRTKLNQVQADLIRIDVAAIP